MKAVHSGSASDILILHVSPEKIASEPTSFMVRSLIGKPDVQMGMRMRKSIGPVYASRLKICYGYQLSICIKELLHAPCHYNPHSLNHHVDNVWYSNYHITK